MKLLSIICFLIFYSVGLAIEKAPESAVKSASSIGNRVIAIISSSEGFYPPNITVFSGEKITFAVTTITKESSCFMLPEKNIFLTSKPGKIATIDTTFDHTGEYKFYCPNGEIKGKLFVINRCRK
ncbi:MAG: cupredoxin domain-containing protein [Oligoflexia bacterium]|nr:cupredoxin domain-containing protein [Oligoflexia bacterium]